MWSLQQAEEEEREEMISGYSPEDLERANEFALRYKDEFDYDGDEAPESLRTVMGALLAFCALTKTPLHLALESMMCSYPGDQIFAEIIYEIRRHVVENR